MNTAPTRDHSSGLHQRRGEPWLLLAPGLLLVTVFVVWPVISSVWWSFYDFSLTSPTREFVGLDNYRKLGSDDVFWLSLRNNLQILIGSVVIQVGGGLALASLLHRGIRRGKTIFSTLIFAPVMMSYVAVGVLWKLIYDPGVGLVPQVLEALSIDPPREGILGDPRIVVWAIVAVASWQYTGFVAVILFAGMQGVDPTLYEAARLDGSSERRAFFHITIPMIRNVLIAVTLLTMIGAFKAFDQVYVLTRGGPANASQVLGTYVFYNGFTVGRAGYANAIAVVLLALALGLGLMQLRFSRSVSE